MSLTLILGRVFDEKWSIFGLNLPLVLCSFNFVCMIYFFYSNRAYVEIKLAEILFLLFSFFLIFFSLINFFYFDFNVYQAYSLNKFLNFVFMTFPICLLIIFNKDNSIGKGILYFISIFTAILNLLLIPDAYISIVNFVRLESFGGGPIVISRLAGFLFLSVLFSKYFRFWIVKLILFFSSIIIIISCQSKGPIIGIIVSVFLFYLLHLFYLNRKRLFSKTVILISFTYFSNVFLFWMVDEGYLVGRLFAYWSQDGQYNNESSLERVDMSNASLNMILEYPLGVGIGNWSKIVSNFGYILPPGDGPYPHNLLVEIISEFGLIVFGIFIFFIITSFKNVLNVFKNRIIENHKDLKLVSILIFYYFFNIFFSGDLTEARYLFMCIFIFNQLSKSNDYRTIKT